MKLWPFYVIPITNMNIVTTSIITANVFLKITVNDIAKQCIHVN